MPVLPLPLFTALILLYLLVRGYLRGEIPTLMRVAIGFCAFQAIIISLNQHYGVNWLAPVQPVSACAIPPLLYLAFLSLARRPVCRSRDSWHLMAPAFSLFCMILAPEALDIVIPAIFTAYGAAILLTLRDGPDAALLERLEEGGLSVLIWRLMALFLIVSAVSDGLIAADYLYQQGEHAQLIHGIASSFTLLALGLAGLNLGSRPAPGRPLSAAPRPPLEEGRHGSDREIMNRLDALMEARQAYLDPDLTLAQLARKLTLPAKILSGAINRQTGMNVSQFVNGHRIQAACRALEQENISVTEAMLAAGFQTKSNFNREFRRVTGTSPSTWRQRGR